jgi:hypothetical protein
MMLALSVIGLTIVTLVLAARLGDAQRQLAEARRESAEQARRAREDQAAYQYGTAVALACLLVGLGAASWHAPHAQARTARFKAGADARAGAADQGTGR